MGSCGFVNSLKRLRKSTSDPIDNVETFNSFKKYMHVTRNAEKEEKAKGFCPWHQTTHSIAPHNGSWEMF